MNEGSIRGVVMKARGRVLRAMAAQLPTAVLFQNGSRHARRVALTFDDGPGPLTTRFFDVLEAAGARASFFVIGEKCEGFGEELSDGARRAHDIAGHGFTHTPFPELGKRRLEDELERTAALLPQRPGQLKMVRPPYGRMTPFSLVRSFRAGYSSAMWSFDPLDWDLRSAREVVDAVDPALIHNGDIILLHEGPYTLEALPEIMARLQNAGFELVTVSTLLRDVAPAAAFAPNHSNGPTNANGSRLAHSSNGR
jgi:peptidoglycan/xylan/chitin deacetylase (PgdA/CDA1 family)